jgi:hypothetical protein
MVLVGRETRSEDHGSARGRTSGRPGPYKVLEQEGFLSLLVGREIQRLCPTNRIGSLAKAFISADDDTAFLLAGLSGGLEVWMTTLPPRTASEL